MGKKLNQVDYLRIKKNIIKRLYSNKAFSKGHLLYERLAAGIPPHLTDFGCFLGIKSNQSKPL